MRAIIGPVAVILTFSLVACSEKHSAPKDKIRSAQESVGWSASFAASTFVEAARECQIAGIADIKICAKNKGVLLPEITAQMLASQAVAKIDDYFSECLPKFSIDYCKDLLERAKQMEWRRPPSKEAHDTLMPESADVDGREPMP
jgi:hypothetical protein